MWKDLVLTHKLLDIDVPALKNIRTGFAGLFIQHSLTEPYWQSLAGGEQI